MLQYDEFRAPFKRGKHGPLLTKSHSFGHRNIGSCDIRKKIDVFSGPEPKVTILVCDSNELRGPFKNGQKGHLWPKVTVLVIETYFLASRLNVTL